MVKLIGDVHGKYGPYKTIMKSCKDSIQVGDMGVGFFRVPNFSEIAMPVINPSYDHMVEGNHRFIRGNHDNPSVCRKHTQWIKDGHTELTPKGQRMMFVGGAWSIDRAWRTEGLDWWNDEQLSYTEFFALITQYEIYQPDIMVTHDAPESIIKQIFFDGTHKQRYISTTGAALDQMWQLHKPKFWIFGHWHEHADVVIDGCRFICLNELETIDLDI